MKILLLGFTRIAHMPYMNDYVSLLSGDHELHLVSWNRSGTKDAEPPAGVAQAFVFDEGVEDESSLKEKLPSIYRYRRFAIRLIRRERYDRIVVLHSTPGIALLDFLERRYHGKYLLDYRDVSHENISFYRKLIARLSEGAGLVIASSPSYLQYLPNRRPALIKHNLLLAEDRPEPRRGGSPVRVRYWGMIRHLQANLALVDELGGDDRFELHYNGREEKVAAALKERVRDRGYGNVFFHGAYLPGEREAFAADTDLLHNVYENDFATTGALGNKLYDGIQFRIPQLCTTGSAMGELVTEKGLGLAIDYSEPGFKELILKYLDAIDYPSFDAACERELAAVMEDNKKASEAIAGFFG